MPIYMIMRKFYYLLSTLILFVFTNEINAQLFVKDNSYVYNKGSYIFVKGDVNLQGDTDVNGTSGNLYLRNEGQLLQGSTSFSTNSGAGKLSVFQEGTVNNYAYNYWCSPVGNGTLNSSDKNLNNLFGITMLNRPTTNSNSTPITTTGSYNGTTNSSSLNIASYWIFKYATPSISYNDWLPAVGANTTIAAGQGFTMKGVSGDDSTDVGETVVNNPVTGPNFDNQRYDFRGMPNDGDITINVGIDTVPNPDVPLGTLTGNPYPSAIDLWKFFDDNKTKLDGRAYYWVQDETVNSHNITSYVGGYATYNFATTSGYFYTDPNMRNYTLGGLPIDLIVPPGENLTILTNAGRFAPVGQGFMVKGITNGTATFKNTQRVFQKEGSTSVFQKTNSLVTNTDDYGFYDDIPNVAGTDYTQISKAPPPHIKFKCSLNSVSIRQVALCFMDGCVDGVDRTDTINPELSSNLPMDMYFYLDNSEYIHSATTFDINKRFPIGIKNNTSGMATFKLKVSDIINFTGSEKVYLYDGLTGLYYNIKGNYHELNLAPGVYNNRFEITFKNADALGLEDNLSINFVIVQNNSNQLLSISNPNLLEIKSVTLYDILGKLIFDKVNLGTNATYEFPTTNLSDGVYVVKLQTTDNKSLGQKIIVKRNN